MRLPQNLLALAAFALAAGLAVLVATVAAAAIEKRSAAAVSARLEAAGMTWATVEADGLQIRLTGTAPNEAARFRAVNLAGGEVEASRVADALEVAPAQAIAAPDFSIEVLRNGIEIQLIGLLPEQTDRAALSARVTGLASGAQVTDMMETAGFPAPEGWEPAVEFGLQALARLANSKISITPARVAITAISGSEDEKRRIESEIAALRPEGVVAAIEISAPRPVLTPFTLRFVRDAEGVRFDACSADTEAARDAILQAAVAAGLEGKSFCTVGLGVPSPRWAEATAAGIAAVGALGQATITFSDADVTLLAAAGTDQATFDRVVGDLDAALPDAFSLQAVLEQAETRAAGPAEFTATRAEGTGRVELRGRLTDEMTRAAVDSFAHARFGVAQVYSATVLDDTLPQGWPLRALAGLEALAMLEHGALVVRPDTVDVSGVTGSLSARARITQLLSQKLGQGKTFRVDVRYDEDLDPLAALPTPQECADRVQAVLVRKKITFTPGSAEIDPAAFPLMQELAGILEECPGVQMEIAGHTDSQGSESGNQALSQARAEAVVVALQGRGVDVAGMTARGYGESRPIADNATEPGREANRRIEFTLTGLPGAGPAGAEAPPAAAPGATASAPGAGAAAAPDFSADTSPSVAPQSKTRRPKARPAEDG